MKKAGAAFTMMEMMVVIFLIGIISAIVIPRVAYRAPKSEWPNILDEVNNLVFFARQEAAANQKNYRLNFKSQSTGQDSVWVEEENDDPEKPMHKIYSAVSSSYFTPKYLFHESVKIKAVYLGKEEQLTEQRGQAFCYVIPDGLVQEVVMHLVRKVDDAEEVRATFKMMPFLGKFEHYEGFLRPE